MVRETDDESKTFLENKKYKHHKYKAALVITMLLIIGFKRFKFEIK